MFDNDIFLMNQVFLIINHLREGGFIKINNSVVKMGEDYNIGYLMKMENSNEEFIAYGFTVCELFKMVKDNEIIVIPK